MAVKLRVTDSDEEIAQDPLRLRSMARQRFGGEDEAMDRTYNNLYKLNGPAASGAAADLLQEAAQAEPRGVAQKLSGLFKEAVRMGYSLAGRDADDLDRRSVRFVSPRFLSLMPEPAAHEQVSIASPSVLSLHDQGQGIENMTSVPSLLAGLPDQDRQAWLDLVMEMSGVNDQLDDLENNLDRLKDALDDGAERYKRHASTENGTALYFTAQNVTELYGKPAADRIEHWDQFLRTITKEQLSELNRTGLAVLSGAQLTHLYGARSPYRLEARRLRELGAPAATLRRRARADVRRLAAAGARVEARAHDLRVLSPLAFVWLVGATSVRSPTILSPVLFAPSVLSPTVLGPMILSPWIFSPQILTPKLLSPLILAPYAFSPLVLSPFAFHAQVLSPGIFNPHILVPFLLSPLILTPQVFSPLILCPQVLSPVILNPTVGSPKVLSPFVLSPGVYSPQALSALVLSPYALSPVFHSRVYLFRLILSPSWLS